MYPILFRIPIIDAPIYSYGLMLAIGFLGAIYLARFLGRRAGIDPEIFVNAGMLAMISGVAGARLSHIIENWSTFTRADLSWTTNLWHMVNIRAGGLTYYGGFLLGTPSVLLYLRHKKVPLRLACDIVAPCIMVALGVGRIGCFLNGCCFGAVAGPGALLTVSYPYWSIPYQQQLDEGKIDPTGVPPQLRDASGQLADPQNLLRAAAGNPAKIISLKQAIAKQRSLSVQPSQLYSTVTAWLIALLCVWFLYLPHAPGRVFALMMIVEGPSRFLLELLRVEPPVLGQMSLSMVLGIGIFAAGIVLWIVLGMRDRGVSRVSPLVWTAAELARS
jgi:phosphatidylglycerol:prolipoprotein diacylglycerol transferase